MVCIWKGPLNTTRKACIGYMEKFGNGPFRSSCCLILCVNKVKLRAKVLIVQILDT